MKYFIHDTSAFEDEKIVELFMNFGYEGIGLFFVILEKLGKQEKPIKTNVLKAQLKVGKKLEKCWNFMESIGLICSNNGETFNEQLLNYNGKYLIKKEKTKERVSRWRENQTVTENVTQVKQECNADKENKSKENKSKENIIPETEVSEVDISPSEKKLFSKIVEVWFSFHFEKYGFQPSFRALDGKKIKSIIEKLKNLSVQKGFEFTDTVAESSFLKLLSLAYSDDWLKSNFELSNIDSKFNSIIQKSTPNGTAAYKIHKQSGADMAAYRDKLINDLQGA